MENAVGFVRRNLMVPMPSAESFQTLTRVWLDECGRVAGSDHCRHDVPVIELFEAEKDHMLPLPGVRFDPCDWRSVKDDNRLDAELRSIGRAGLVIIDELGHLPIDIDGARLLFQAGADSYETRSVIFTSNLESGRWGDVFGDGDMAAAVIDRIVHHGRILRFHGESYRNKHSLMK